jgi:Na+/phosphate symporter
VTGIARPYLAHRAHHGPARAAIRRYLADIGNAQPLDDEGEGARGQEILSAVINLEHAGDIIANICSSLQRGALGARAALPRRNSMR